jgi:hypothetical protein
MIVKIAMGKVVCVPQFFVGGWSNLILLYFSSINFAGHFSVNSFLGRYEKQFF